MQTQHRGLRTFCTAAEHLSFKKAANELSLTPSAVSHQISDLEEELGTKLFKRLTRSISLTQDGSHLYREINPYLRAIDNATTKIRRQKTRYPLLVQMPEFFASELLMPRMNEFSEAYPDIDLRIEGIGITDDLNPAADINILLSRKTPNAIKVAKLFPIRYIPACSREQKKKWELEGISELAAIKKATILLHKARPKAWEQWAKNAGVEGLRPKKIIYVDSMFALSRAAEQGVGIALMPLPVSQDWFDSGSLVALHESHLVTEDYYWLILNGNSNRKISLVFWHWLIKTFNPQQLEM
ncbi:MAG: LysR family transcriptional regulator [Pseudomonadales bacterium]|jgi:LysR family glycine cleavage system transcriptional activator